MDIGLLVKITSRAWSLSILGHLSEGVPGRQAPLLAATGANRTAFGKSIDHLIEIGLLERNPGHGHPLRPEYRLTPFGSEVGKAARTVLEMGGGEESASVLRKSWSVPVLAVCRTPRYFGEVKAALSPITDRALSLSLKQLDARGWLERDIDPDARPPRARYLSVEAGARIGQIVDLRAS